MDLSAATLWWLAAGALVAVELATGTFYLLMLSLGCVAGAMVAHAGLSATPQLLAAALVGIGATALWYWRRAKAPRAAPVDANRDAHLDIGQSVQVDHWNADGSARVSYRGAAWAVQFAGDGQPSAGEHVIVAMQGNTLRVGRAR